MANVNPKPAPKDDEQVRPHPDFERERNRIYDRATEGDPELATASAGGRGIDLLKSDIAGTPLDDEADPSAIPSAEDDATR